MDPSDREMIERVQGGEREAYIKLFDRYYGRVESYARRQMGNAEAARDLASETFLRAYRHCDQFRLDEGISYLGYLLLICRRLILTEQARLHNNPVQSLDADTAQAERIAADTVPPLDRVLMSERKTMLHEALARLSEDDREIIHLAFERDLSRREMVTILEKPSVSAVTSHLHRAMQKLKTIVMAQGYFSFEPEKGRK